MSLDAKRLERGRLLWRPPADGRGWRGQGDLPPQLDSMPYGASGFGVSLAFLLSFDQWLRVQLMLQDLTLAEFPASKSPVKNVVSGVREVWWVGRSGLVRCRE
jgi:hypothetical protein